MDLTFSDTELAFRDELRGWLADNPAPPRPAEGGDDADFAWRRDWQRQLSDAGWAAHDGLTMLVGQAAAAFQLWFAVSPDQASALEACRAAVAARA
jgi:hypothetical protein